LKEPFHLAVGGVEDNHIGARNTIYTNSAGEVAAENSNRNCTYNLYEQWEDEDCNRNLDRQDSRWINSREAKEKHKINEPRKINSGTAKCHNIHRKSFGVEGFSDRHAILEVMSVRRILSLIRERCLTSFEMLQMLAAMVMTTMTVTITKVAEHRECSFEKAKRQKKIVMRTPVINVSISKMLK
jgi:hypothetical protein